MEINLCAPPRRTWCMVRRVVLELAHSLALDLWSGDLFDLRPLDPPAARARWAPSQPGAMAPQPVGRQGVRRYHCLLDCMSPPQMKRLGFMPGLLSEL